ncbi:MAG: hypothetical protein K8L99_17590 [Anaerolineae bacterium]|nr:hypothetical protein [Anaerolineae bacterium]
MAITVETIKDRHDIDFVSRYSLEDCIYRLGKLDDRRRYPFAPITLLRLQYLDDNTCAFQVAERLPAPVVIHGYLNRLQSDATYVSGHARIRRHRLIGEVLIGFGLIALIALLVGTLVIVLYLPVAAVFFWRYQRGVADEHRRLVRVFRDLLSY